MNEYDRNFDDYRIFYSLESLLRIKASSQTRKGLKDFSSAIKDIRTYFHSYEDVRLLKYLYCYLYRDFEDDSISMDISVENRDKISVVTSKINEKGKICYSIDLLSIVDDKELPIKRENCVIEMDRKNNKAVLSRRISYSTDSGMEMVLLDCDSSIVDVDRVTSLFEETHNINCSKVLFRDFYDPLFITEIDISKEPVIKHYTGRVDKIDRIVRDKETTIDDYEKSRGILYHELRDIISNKRTYYSEYLYETLLPYMYHVSKQLQEKTDYDNYYYDNNIDYEVIELINNKNITDFTKSYNDIMNYIEDKKNKNRGSK